MNRNRNLTRVRCTLAAALVAAAFAMNADAACGDEGWVRYKPYAAGDVVRHTDGNTYRAKHANPGYVPTISTYYWAPYSCRAVATKPACATEAWVRGRSYAVGDVVAYAGRHYKAKYANPGYPPNTSTYYWAPHFCPGSQPAAGQWAVIGSSTAAGSGASSLSAAWVGALSSSYANRGVTIVNLARPGTTTYHGLPSSSPTLPARPAPLSDTNIDAALAWSPKIVFISYPTNDTVSGFTVEETVDNVVAMRQKAVEAGASVIVVSTQPRAMSADQLGKLAQIDERLSSIAGACFVATREALLGPDGRIRPDYNSGDDIHVNDLGHNIIHNKVLAVIESGQCVAAPGQ